MKIFAVCAVLVFYVIEGQCNPCASGSVCDNGDILGIKSVVNFAKDVVNTGLSFIPRFPRPCDSKIIIVNPIPAVNITGTYETRDNTPRYARTREKGHLTIKESKENVIKKKPDEETEKLESKLLSQFLRSISPNSKAQKNKETTVIGHPTKIIKDQEAEEKLQINDSLKVKGVDIKQDNDVKEKVKMLEKSQKLDIKIFDKNPHLLQNKRNKETINYEDISVVKEKTYTDQIPKREIVPVEKSQPEKRTTEIIYEEIPTIVVTETISEEKPRFDSKDFKNKKHRKPEIQITDRYITDSEKVERPDSWSRTRFSYDDVNSRKNYVYKLPENQIRERVTMDDDSKKNARKFIDERIILDDTLQNHNKKQYLNDHDTEARIIEKITIKNYDDSISNNRRLLYDRPERTLIENYGGKFQEPPRYQREPKTINFFEDYESDKRHNRDRHIESLSTQIKPKTEIIEITYRDVNDHDFYKMRENPSNFYRKIDRFIDEDSDIVLKEKNYEYDSDFYSGPRKNYDRIKKKSFDNIYANESYQNKELFLDNDSAIDLKNKISIDEKYFDYFRKPKTINKNNTNKEKSVENNYDIVVNKKISADENDLDRNKRRERKRNKDSNGNHFFVNDSEIFVKEKKSFDENESDHNSRHEIIRNKIRNQELFLDNSDVVINEKNSFDENNLNRYIQRDKNRNNDNDNYSDIILNEKLSIDENYSDHVKRRRKNRNNGRDIKHVLENDSDIFLNGKISIEEIDSDNVRKRGNNRNNHRSREQFSENDSDIVINEKLTIDENDSDHVIRHGKKRNNDQDRERFLENDSDTVIYEKLSINDNDSDQFKRRGRNRNIDNDPEIVINEKLSIDKNDSDYVRRRSKNRNNDNDNYSDIILNEKLSIDDNYSDHVKRRRKNRNNGRDIKHVLENDSDIFLNGKISIEEIDSDNVRKRGNNRNNHRSREQFSESDSDIVINEKLSIDENDSDHVIRHGKKRNNDQDRERFLENDSDTVIYEKLSIDDNDSDQFRRRGRNRNIDNDPEIVINEKISIDKNDSDYVRRRSKNRNNDRSRERFSDIVKNENISDDENDKDRFRIRKNRNNDINRQQFLDSNSNIVTNEKIDIDDNDSERLRKRERNHNTDEIGNHFLHDGLDIVIKENMHIKENDSDRLRRRGQNRDKDQNKKDILDNDSDILIKENISIDENNSNPNWNEQHDRLPTIEKHRNHFSLEKPGIFDKENDHSKNLNSARLLLDKQLDTDTSEKHFISVKDANRYNNRERNIRKKNNNEEFETVINEKNIIKDESIEEHDGERSQEINNQIRSHDRALSDTVISEKNTINEHPVDGSLRKNDVRNQINETILITDSFSKNQHDEDIKISEKISFDESNKNNFLSNRGPQILVDEGITVDENSYIPDVFNRGPRIEQLDNYNDKMNSEHKSADQPKIIFNDKISTDDYPTERNIKLIDTFSSNNSESYQFSPNNSSKFVEVVQVNDSKSNNNLEYGHWNNKGDFFNNNQDDEKFSTNTKTENLDNNQELQIPDKSSVSNNVNRYGSGIEIKKTEVVQENEQSNKPSIEPDNNNYNPNTNLGDSGEILNQFPQSRQQNEKKILKRDAKILNNQLKDRERNQYPVQNRSANNNQNQLFRSVDPSNTDIPFIQNSELLKNIWPNFTLHAQKPQEVKIIKDKPSNQFPTLSKEARKSLSLEELGSFQVAPRFSNLYPVSNGSTNSTNTGIESNGNKNVNTDNNKNGKENVDTNGNTNTNDNKNADENDNINTSTNDNNNKMRIK